MLPFPCSCFSTPLFYPLLPIIGHPHQTESLSPDLPALWSTAITDYRKPSDPYIHNLILIPYIWVLTSLFIWFYKAGDIARLTFVFDVWRSNLEVIQCDRNIIFPPPYLILRRRPTWNFVSEINIKLIVTFVLYFLSSLLKISDTIGESGAGIRST
jgi:hypothetical protein